jgi:hypothetical protein
MQNQKITFVQILKKDSNALSKQMELVEIWQDRELAVALIQR